MDLVEERLSEINNTVSVLTGRVDDMDRRIEELEYERDMEELYGEMQMAMTSVVADFRKEL